MEKEFVPYELALKLKALGFDEPYYFATYLDSLNIIPREEEDGWDLSKGIIAPLYQQAFRWFRENYKLFGGILSEYSYGGQIHAYHITGKRQSDISQGDFETYEEAELACLEKLIEIIEYKSE